MMKLVIATKNTNKIREIKDKIKSEGIDILPLGDFSNLPDVIEDGLTFEENALKKAKIYSEFTGLAVLSDDSGIEIDALSGAPGVRSARYAGENATDEENNDLVLLRLQNVPVEKRTARFVCVIVVVLPDGNYFSERGTCEGSILFERKGVNGFGYDPIFYIPEIGKTMAEMTIQEKNIISHRARALGKTAEILQKLIVI